MVLGKHSSKLKAWARLDGARQRRDQGLFLVEGPAVVEELLGSALSVEALVCQPESYSQWVARAARAGVECYHAEPAAMAKLSQAETCQGVVAVARLPKRVALRQQAQFLVYLEEIQDPGNLGTLIRTSRAAGVEQLLVNGGADPYSPKVIRASAGGVFYLSTLPVSEPPNGRWELVAAVPEGGRSLFEADLTGPIVVAIGNESRGLKSSTLTRAKRKITIPMTAGCESLNAAVSGALIVYERYRQCG